MASGRRFKLIITDQDMNHLGSMDRYSLPISATDDTSPTGTFDLINRYQGSAIDGLKVIHRILMDARPNLRQYDLVYLYPRTRTDIRPFVLFWGLEKIELEKIESLNTLASISLSGFTTYTQDLVIWPDFYLPDAEIILDLSHANQLVKVS